MFFLFLTSLNLISSLSSLTFLNISLSHARPAASPARPSLPRPAGSAPGPTAPASPALGAPRRLAPQANPPLLRCARPPCRPNVVPPSSPWALDVPLHALRRCRCDKFGLLWKLPFARASSRVALMDAASPLQPHSPRAPLPQPPPAPSRRYCMHFSASGLI